MIEKRTEYSNDSFIFRDLLKELSIINNREERETKFRFRRLIDRYIPETHRMQQLDNTETIDDENDISGTYGNMDETISTTGPQVLCPGDRTLQLIFRNLERVFRSPSQVEFHKMFTGAILRQIYKDDYKKHCHRVKKEYGFESFKQLVLLCCPRRFGKTWSVSMWTLVIAICLPGSQIAIFSPGRRQSTAMINHIYNFCKKMDETDRVIRRNEEKMILRSVDGSESVINAYPSCVRTLKGVSGNILILEEMAVIDTDIIYEVVAPLLIIDETSMIGISTITGENNYMTKYLQQRDNNGELLFHSRHFFLACNACMEAGKAANCKHNSYMLPNWSSPRKRRVINCIMEGQEMLLNQELGGIASSVNGRAFAAHMIQRCFQKDPWHIEPNDYYHQIFVSIDPNGAGKNSDFAITTMLRIDGKYIIIGMESFTSKTAAENHALILRHLKSLEANPCFKNALKVFIIESNLGLESEHINHMLYDRGVSNFLVMKEKENTEKIGFLTTNGLKNLAVERLREVLAEGTLRLCPDKDLVCISRAKWEIKEMLEKQMSDFQEVVKDNFQNVGPPRKMYSGKSVGKDDLIMTLLLGIFWSSVFFNDARYRQYHTY